MKHAVEIFHKSQSSPWLLILALLLSFHGIGANLLVITFERCQIFTRLGELTLFNFKFSLSFCAIKKIPYLLHTLTNIPVHKRTLRVHKIKLVVETVPRGADSRSTE
jgi:hypothetical protein